jgi:hypothetical protein
MQDAHDLGLIIDSHVPLVSYSITRRNACVGFADAGKQHAHFADASVVCH